jgi:Tfp pilus assembly protein FimV
MTRTRVRLGRTTAVIGAALSVAVLAGNAAGSEPGGPAGPPEPRYVVRPGDTLWEIARSNVGPEGDPRPLVQAIREANGLGPGALQAGSRIVVPPAP